MVVAELGISRQANGFYRTANGVRHERAWTSPAAPARRLQHPRRLTLAQAEPAKHPTVPSTSVKSEHTNAQQVRSSTKSLPLSITSTARLITSVILPEVQAASKPAYQGSAEQTSDSRKRHAATAVFVALVSC